jgi:hypothetical protein
MAQDVTFIPVGFMFWTFNARTGEDTCDFATYDGGRGYRPYGSGSLDDACPNGTGDTFAFWGDFVRYITDRAHAPIDAEYAYSGAEVPDGRTHHCSDHRGVGVLYGW